MDFDIPAAPDDARERPDWRIVAAYRNSTVLLDDDRLLYRIPAYVGDSVDVSMIPQPEGYPLAAISKTGCD